MFDLLATNVRVPDHVLGDIRSQIASANMGERQYLKLVERYGTSTVQQYTNALLYYSEQLVRNEIAGLADGTYDFTHYIDGDNIDTGDVKIQVRMTVEGESMHVDFDGTSPQVKAGIKNIAMNVERIVIEIDKATSALAI